MVVIDSCVENRDNHVAASGCDTPCLGRIDVGIRSPTRLADIVKSPHLTKPGVIGYQRCSQNVVRFSVQDIGILSKKINRVFHGDAGKQLDDLQPTYNLESFFARTEHPKSRQVLLGFIDPFTELYDDFIGDVLWTLSFRLGSILRTRSEIQTEESKHKDRHESYPLDHESLLKTICWLSYFATLTR